MTHDVDKMETQLGTLFRAQADAIDVGEREWSDVPVASVVSMEAHRSSRTKKAFMIGGGVLVAAVLALTIGLYGVGSPRLQTRAPAVANPNAARTVTFTADSKRVTLAASDYRVVASGKTFTTKGAHVDVHGDPGGPDYWTLELEWNEQGAGQRMNMYFRSDGKDWWADEIRVYNGQPQGDWITWTGTYFKTPVGQPYVGDVNLVDKASGASLSIANMKLTTQAEQFKCNVGTGKYAIGTDFEQPELELMAHGGGSAGELFLLDRTTCTKAPNAERYAFSFTSDDPAIASVPSPQSLSTGTTLPNIAGFGDCRFTGDEAACLRGINPSYQAGHTGKTVLHAVAKDTTTGEIVAKRDFPVTVAPEGVAFNPRTGAMPGAVPLPTP